ncbi:MAG: hypothetical protein QM756_30160 [Polyangiaceae bacterium]
MKPIRVLARSALSPLGRGRAAWDVGVVGDPAPSALRSEGGLPLGRVDDAGLEASGDSERAARLLFTAAYDLGRELESGAARLAQAKAAGVHRYVGWCHAWHASGAFGARAR